MNYWIGVVSRDHVMKGFSGGFCQLCHGKQQPLKRMKKGDFIIYYSPKEIFKEMAPCQKFTAIGKVIGDDIYSFEMSPGFVPYRRDIDFFDCKAIDIRPLIAQLDFITNKKNWGMNFRYGHLQISKADFELISSQMLEF